MLPVPTYSEVSKQGESIELHFPSGKIGSFVTRGGISWPGQDDTQQADFSHGFACVLALEIATGFMFVFDEFMFISVEMTKTASGEKSVPGLAHWFNQVWLTYKCGRFYTRENEMVEERYRRQILTDKSIGQRPAIIDADDWPGDDAAQGMIFTRKLERRLYHAKELHLHEALSKAKLSRMGISAPVRAVAAAMIGLERMETRMRKSRNDVDLV